MSKKKPQSSAQALRNMVESLSISAFAGDDASDPVRLLPRLLGAGTTVAPMYHCADVGGWISGWTVVVPLAGGVHAFGIREFVNALGHEVPWVNLSRGSRVDSLTHAVEYPVWSAGDVPGLVVGLVEHMAEIGDGPQRYDFDSPGALNTITPWVLAHAMSLLSDVERDGVWLMLGLRFDGAMLRLVERLVSAAGNVAANRRFLDETETVTIAAVERFNGVTLRGAQLERLGVPGALMTYPRELWEVEADRLVACAYETQTLDESFYPPSSPSVRQGPSRTGRSGQVTGRYAIAG